MHRWIALAQEPSGQHCLQAAPPSACPTAQARVSSDDAVGSSLGVEVAALGLIRLSYSLRSSEQVDTGGAPSGCRMESATTAAKHAIAITYGADRTHRSRTSSGFRSTGFADNRTAKRAADETNDEEGSSGREWAGPRTLAQARATRNPISVRAAVTSETSQPMAEQVGHDTRIAMTASAAENFDFMVVGVGDHLHGPLQPGIEIRYVSGGGYRAASRTRQRPTRRIAGDGGT